LNRYHTYIITWLSHHEVEEDLLAAVAAVSVFLEADPVEQEVVGVVLVGFLEADFILALSLCLFLC
jgi:hypothetical protein